jgi:predicted secreted hydrolase
MNKKLYIPIFTFLALALYGISTLRKPAEATLPSASLVANLSEGGDFARANAPREWDFPTDMGAHPDYQTEWWYYTGNLESADGQHFGYQLTFFRRALVAADGRTERESTLGANQVYMAHFALSDVDAENHQAFERLTRGSAGLAGAESSPYSVWLEDWQVEEIGDGQYRLIAQQGEFGLDLILNNAKGIILQGDEGYSRKGEDVGNASYYYSQTRLETSGTVRTERGSFDVEGLSWKDHEFSTSALSEGQIGWDWFSLQLDDGSELMFFQIRRADGSIDPFSSGTYINPEGGTTQLERNQFEIRVRDVWVSPESGAEYPSAWEVSIPSLNLELEVEPYFNAQEMDVSYFYWEGAVKVSGSLAGSGYVEMTGYERSMEGEF